MKFVKPSYEIISCPDGEEVLSVLELAARNCYKSEEKIDPGERCSCLTLTRGFLMPCDKCNQTGWIREPSSHKLIRDVLKMGHESVIEHVSVTVRFIVNRGVTHELVRHRLVSYSQESTRYCNYSKGRFGSELTIIEPSYRSPVDVAAKEQLREWKHQEERRQVWEHCLRNIEKTYNRLIQLGEKPQEARDILPIGLKTEIVTTANLREWRHIFKLRAINERAHPQIREVMILLLAELKQRIPIIFDDIVE